MESSVSPPAVVVPMCYLGHEAQKSSIDAPCSWYWGLLSSEIDNLSMVPVVKTNSLVVTRGAIEEIAFKGVLLMKQLSKCRPIDLSLVVAAPLELPPRVT
ncbi:hypothetical protein HanRHA438_Chr03g0143941 [Helianthus annuus]|nr:hypothetical protein HanRHA438_Chr03g0143941 [Helianthus annuus]